MNVVERLRTAGKGVARSSPTARTVVALVGGGHTWSHLVQASECALQEEPEVAVSAGKRKG
eukprot:1547920-Rhodomonas_salina.2